MLRITIYLKDGRNLSGVYNLRSILAQLAYALKRPEFLGFTLVAP